MEEGKQDKLRKREKEEGKEKKKTELNVTLGASREENKSLLTLFFFFAELCSLFCYIHTSLCPSLRFSVVVPDFFLFFFSFISVDQNKQTKKQNGKKNQAAAFHTQRCAGVCSKA